MAIYPVDSVIQTLNNWGLVFVCLTNLAQHLIWLGRNDFRFRNQLPSVVDVIAAV